MGTFKKIFDKKLPDWCEFYSSLKDECISGNNYLHAINVWNILEKKAMGDYHYLY